MIASTPTNHPTSTSETTPSPSSEPLQQACARLKAAGLRITQPRLAILGALIRHRMPTSIERLHRALGNSASSACDLVTVYRCLGAFEELGLVRRCFFHNGTSLYQIALDDAPTYHVVDKTQNAVFQLDADLADELRQTLRRIEDKLKERGFEQVTPMVEFFARSTPAPAGAPADSAISATA